MDFLAFRSFRKESLSCSAKLRYMAQRHFDSKNLKALARSSKDLSNGKSRDQDVGNDKGFEVPWVPSLEFAAFPQREHSV